MTWNVRVFQNPPAITQKILPLCPHPFYQGLLFLPAYHPDGQDHLHAKQHKKEQPHLQEREPVWDAFVIVNPPRTIMLISWLIYQAVFLSYVQFLSHHWSNPLELQKSHCLGDGIFVYGYVDIKNWLCKLSLYQQIYSAVITTIFKASLGCSSSKSISPR